MKTPNGGHGEVPVDFSCYVLFQSPVYFLYFHAPVRASENGFRLVQPMRSENLPAYPARFLCQRIIHAVILETLQLGLIFVSFSAVLFKPRPSHQQSTAKLGSIRVSLPRDA